MNVAIEPQQLARCIEGLSDIYRLTSLQAAMVHEYENNARQGSGVYHVQQSFRIEESSPSPSALRAALQVLVNEHPVMRTVLVRTRTGEIVQAVKERVEVVLIEHQLAELSPDEQDLAIEKARADDRARLFQLDEPDSPMFRCYWFQLSERRFEFLMSIHHAIDDGWGNQQFLRELARLYQRIKAGDPVQAAPRPNVFREYVALEHEMRESAEAAEFWKRSNFAVHRFAASRRADREDRAAEGSTFFLEPAAVRTIRGAARNAPASIRAVFLAAFISSLESRVGARLTVGVVSNGRSERLSDPLNALGLFWNFVPISIDPNALSPTLLVRAVHQRLLEVERYTLYPFASVAAAQGHGRLFDATFNFVDFHGVDAGPLSAGSELIATQSFDRFHYPLNCAVSLDRVSARAAIHFEWDADYLCADWVAALAEHFVSSLMRIGNGVS